LFTRQAAFKHAALQPLTPSRGAQKGVECQAHVVWWHQVKYLGPGSKPTCMSTNTWWMEGG